MKKLNVLSVTFIVCLLAGCASNQKGILKYRESIQKKDYMTALQLMQSDSIYKDDQSRLLKFLELGTLHLHNGEYYQALQNFDKARDLSDKLFTVSVTKRLAGTLGNESSDNYSGEKYERSLIRYYTLITHYLLYEKGSYEAYTEVSLDDNGKVVNTKPIGPVVLDDAKKRFHLIAAKSILLEWNSILEDYKKTYAGEVTYKDDLLAKLVGAVLHEKADSSSDLQIALNLYKESKNTIFKYYNSYQSFNGKYSEFNKEYKNLPNMKMEKVLANYVAATPLATSVLSYADDKVKNWSKNNSSEKDNVYIVWHEGLIANKEIKKYEFPIGLEKATIAAGTAMDFVAFSKKALLVVDQIIPKISFEMPAMPFRSNSEDYHLVIKKTGSVSANGIKANVVIEKPALLVGPLSEMAFYSLESKALTDLVLVGTRVAAKHLAALGAAYLTYKNIKDKMGEGIALMSGIAAYNLAAKGIAETEKADLRSWMTLPSQIRMNSFKLPGGDYELYSLNVTSKEEKLVGNFKVQDGEKVSLKTFL